MLVPTTDTCARAHTGPNLPTFVTFDLKRASGPSIFCFRGSITVTPESGKLPSFTVKHPRGSLQQTLLLLSNHYFVFFFKLWMFSATKAKATYL